MSGYGWRPHIESALCISVRDFFSRAGIKPSCWASGTWTWSSYGEKIGAVGYAINLGNDSGELRLTYNWSSDNGPQDVECVVRLSSKPLHYGGRRWYMHCPYTGRRCLKLYKFGSIEKFCCRTAIRPLPTYASQRVGGTDRIFLQRWALRRRMGDDFSDLFGEPYRPKGMHWHTFQRYADRDAELERREGGYVQRLIQRLERYG